MMSATGARIGPDSFESAQPATSTAAPSTRGGVTLCITTQIAPAAAVKNSAAVMSDVTSGPCARNVGLNTKRPRLSHPASGDTKRRDHA